MCVQPRVQGPQFGLRLAHATDSVFHAARPDQSTTGRKGAGAETLGEDLEKGNGVVRQGSGVHTDAATESGPDVPGALGGLGTFGGDAMRRRRLNSAPVSLELVAELRWSMCHGEAWGWARLKCEMSSLSDKSQRRLASSAITLACPAM